MNLPLRLRRVARRDLQSAMNWYREHASGLGDDLFEEVRKAMLKIIERPRLFREVHKDIRRAQTDRFPYGVYYRILEEKIVVVAIQHLRRHPRTWQSRS
jgi:plasmid stabilization system protein ParE